MSRGKCAKPVPENHQSTPQGSGNLNLHFLALADFKAFCAAEGIAIRRIRCIPNGWLSRLLVRFGRCNLGAERVVAEITRAPG
ncbi:MAG: hypothetical protein ABIF71_12565 [Planctomycetota bacterium]